LPKEKTYVANGNGSGLEAAFTKLEENLPDVAHEAGSKRNREGEVRDEEGGQHGNQAVVITAYRVCNRANGVGLGAVNEEEE